MLGAVVAQSRVFEPSSGEKGVYMGVMKSMWGKEGIPAGRWSLQGIGLQEG